MTIYHKHHIIPKHMGGSDDASNLVQLSIEEHAEAHKKLWEEHGKWQDKIAWKMLSGQITAAEAIKETQREYMTNRIVSEDTRKKMGESNCRRAARGEHPLKNFKFTEESKQKMRESHLGQIPWNKGKIKTEEEIEKDRLAQHKVPKYKCEICGKECRGMGNLNQHMSKHKRDLIA